ncbi:Mu transposase C-terminal domain-containing protein [Kitasatospora sp. NPDC051853]|uniref:Mu transposase C-terminal domain-containing protein n=1 Tax=Kitasatospora sp. NPDC051853 TaxID=3364058 RepID=UPI00378F6E0E
MFRLLSLQERGVLTPAHVRLAASSAGRSVRTVQRWLQEARQEGRTARKPRPRFTVTDEVHARLALWRGNAAAVHRELVAQARASQGDPVGGGADGEPAGGAGGVGVPSLATFQRAVRRDLNAGQRAALKDGERARRLHDVYLARPVKWRNACWEGDHKHLPVEVELDGQLVRPWVTWFIDCARNAITGAAVTPHQPSRDAVLAALRIALSRDEPGGPYGPIGGLPELVRVDRGKEFLCATVSRALGALAVPVQDLPARRPELKGTVENLNHCVTVMFLVAQPGYLHAPTATTRPQSRRADPAEVLSFTEFTARLLRWVSWWNTEHRPQPLGGRTPLQAWQDDPTPIEDVPPDLLRSFTLEDAGHAKALTTKGVYWRGRYYVGPWMHGRDGTQVRVRFVPHHDHEIEVFDAITGAYLGPAHPANAATPAQRAALRRAKDAERRTMVRALSAADRQRRRLGRYGAVTEPTAPRPLAALTAAEAEEQLVAAAGGGSALAKRALPDLIPPREAPTSWARPIRRPHPAPPATATNAAAPGATGDPGTADGTREDEGEGGRS